MTSFSIDEAAMMFKADVGSLLPQLEKASRAAASLPSLEVADEDDPFTALGFVGHSLVGISRTVGAAGLADCGALVEELAAEGRVALEHARAQLGRARRIAEALLHGVPVLEAVVQDELRGQGDEARQRAGAWRASNPVHEPSLLGETEGPGINEAMLALGAAAVPVDEGDIHSSQTRFVEVPKSVLQDAFSFSTESVPEPLVKPEDGEGLDEELVAVFRSEAEELAGPVRAAFSRLGSEVRESAAELDRLFHTLKGAAASVGLERVAQLAKELEDTFENVARGLTLLDAGLHARVRDVARSAFALAGVDLGVATSSVRIVAPAALQLEAADDGEADEMVVTFRLEVREHAANIREQLRRLPDDKTMDTLTHLERAFHTIKGAAATVGLTEIVASARELQEMLEQIVEGILAPPEDLHDTLVQRAQALFELIKIPPETREDAQVREISEDFALEARHTLEQVSRQLDSALGASDAGERANAQREIAALLHRFGGAAAMNQMAAVAEEALGLERDCLQGTISPSGLVGGLGRIARAVGVDVVLPDLPPETSVIVERTGTNSRTGTGTAARNGMGTGTGSGTGSGTGTGTGTGSRTGAVREAVELMSERAVYDAFVEECGALLDGIDQSILELQDSAQPRNQLRELSRLIHTLKGSVNTVGLRPTGRLLHRFEDAMESLVGRTLLPSARSIASLLLGMQDEVRRHLRTAHRGWVDSNFAAFERDIESLLGTGQRTLSPRLGVVEADEVETAREGEVRSIRVASERIDSLMTLAGEMVLSRSRLLARVGNLRGMQTNLIGSRQRLLGVVENFVERYEFNLVSDRRRQLVVEDTGRVPVLTMVDGAPTVGSTSDAPGRFSDLELDRYEDVNILARSLAEVSSDINEVHHELFAELASFVEDSESFSTLVSTLQREVTSTRMVPLETLYTRVRLLIIDAAERQSKDVRTELKGRQVALDKSILDALYTPLLHLVRNAVAHGIEPPDERERLGKPRTGQVTLSARQEAGRVVIDIADDGRGLDLVALRDRGVELGIIPAGTPETSPLVPGLVFAPGLSTRKSADAQSGRGIGGDAVKSAIEALNGSISISTSSGKGTIFHIVLPLSLAIIRALVVKNGSYNYAIPLYLTEHILQAGEANVFESSGVRRLMFEGHSILAVPLGELLGIPNEAEEGPYVITRIGDARLALRVDAVVRQEEVFVRSLGSLLTGHPLFGGVTVSGTGDVELIVDVNGLMNAAGVIQRIEAQEVVSTTVGSAPRKKQAGPRRRRALVVDDSLSVRKVAAKFLNALGVEVVLAVDGADALEKLRTEKVDIVFTDLEMPRMHGYELIREIRFIPTFMDLPVVVVTSRSSQKHREHARALGANDYVTKPFTQDRFAEIMGQWLDRAEEGAQAGAP
jgi:chemosensory pili system protein ChpA (sensor histidine kinase/response regulator)